MANKDDLESVDQSTLEALQLRLQTSKQVVGIVASAIDEDNYGEAEEALSCMLSTCTEESRPEILLWKGRMLRRMAKREAEALSCLEEAAQSLAETEPCLPCDIALAKANLGNTEEAIDILRQLEDSGKCDLPTELFLNIAQLYLRLATHKRSNTGDGNSLASGEMHTGRTACNCNAVIYFEKALRTKNYSISWRCWQDAGNAAGNAGLHEFAIECFRTMISLPSYPGSFEPLYYIALSYYSMGRFDRAATYIDKIDSLDFASLPENAHMVAGIVLMHCARYDAAVQQLQRWLISTSDKGTAHTLIGNAYALSSDTKLARDQYNLAITTPDYLAADAWNNMGVAHAKDGNLKEAEACFSRFTDNEIEIDWKSASVAFNHGLAKRGNGDASGSVSFFEKAAKIFDECNRFYDAEICAALAKPSQIGSSSILSNMEYKLLGMPEPHDPLAELLAAEAASVLKQNEYLAKFDTRPPSDTKDDCLVVLKGWSSSEPLYASSTQSIAGGGYLLRWRGRGLAIDPGINYLTNLHSLKCHIQDIDGVLVTHDHIDHNHDLRAIDDLVYQVSQDERYRKTRLVFLDKESDDRFHRFSCKDNSQNYAFAPAFEDTRLESRTPRSEESILPGVRIVPFPTEHHINSFGIKCQLTARDGNTILFGNTSDTRYTKELSESLADCHIVVAHISSPDPCEYTDKTYFKKSHLGLNGVRKLIETTTGQLYVITEFWAGLTDRRIPLCRKLRCDLEEQASDRHVCILPADLGLTIDFRFDEEGEPQFGVKCTRCGTPTDCNALVVTGPDVAYGPLTYWCYECYTGSGICVDCASRTTYFPGIPVFSDKSGSAPRRSFP